MIRPLHFAIEATTLASPPLPGVARYTRQLVVAPAVVAAAQAHAERKTWAITAAQTLTVLFAAASSQR